MITSASFADYIMNPFSVLSCQWLPVVEKSSSESGETVAGDWW